MEAGMVALGRSIRIALIAGVVAAGVAYVVPAASAATVDPSAWYVLVARHSGKALDVFNRATADGAQLVQWARNDGAWQQWQFVDSGDGFYRLRSRHSGKVVDVAGRSTADGAGIVQTTDGNATSQQFRLADSSGGYVRLVNRNSGKVVDVNAQSTADGARLIQWTDRDAANQQWLLVRLGSTPGTPTPTLPAAYPNPIPVSGDTSVHDPTMIRTPSGGYLVVHTGANLPIKTSSDRVAYRNAGSVFPAGAPWTTQYTGGSRNLWAPDLSFRNGRYYLYYSASTFGSNHSAIFLATSTTGASGSWTHEGLIIETSTSNNYNAIDPNLIVDDQNRWWLSFGSFWSGIMLIQLDPTTGRRLDGTIRAIAGRGGGAIEAPFVFRRGGFYYLFVSFDQCCRGAASTYRIMVGRSTSVTGPYLDRSGMPMTSGGGTQILAGHGSIHGPGHQAVLADTDGDLLIYHYYTDSGASRLGLNRLGYDSAGWPFAS
jgi:arabinan endo-1,5-alpha-L-arabinosidase